MDIDRWTDAVLAEADAAGARAEIQVVHEHREELVAVSGIIGSLGESTEMTASLRLFRDGHVSVVTAPTTSAPSLICAEALELLGRLPPWPPMAALPAQQAASRDDGRVPSGPLAALGPGLAARTAADGGDELRCTQYRRRVHFAAPGVRRGYRTCGARLTYRLSYADPASGRRAHVEHGDAGPDMAVLAGRLEDRVLAPGQAHARALATPAAGPVPGRVIIDAEVAARLLALLAKGFSAEAVAHGRSRLAGSLGDAVAAPSVTIIDDPAAPGGPGYAAFDDEGSPTRRRELISGGKLAALLGSRAYSDAGEGGCAWQTGPATAPRPTASNLWLEVAGLPLPEDGPADEPVMRVVQSQGMHTCNDITGEFSMGAFALVQTSSGATGVSGLTVAGNVYDVLRNVEAAGDRLHWYDGGDGCFGAPSLLVRGLSVGR